MNAGTCNSCGARILWSLTENGKKVPLNPPEKRFVCYMPSDSAEHVKIVETYISHFVTCPSAASHRK